MVRSCARASNGVRGVGGAAASIDHHSARDGSGTPCSWRAASCASGGSTGLVTGWGRARLGAHLGPALRALLVHAGPDVEGAVDLGDAYGSSSRAAFSRPAPAGLLPAALSTSRLTWQQVPALVHDRLRAPRTRPQRAVLRRCRHPLRTRRARGLPWRVACVGCHGGWHARHTDGAPASCRRGAPNCRACARGRNAHTARLRQASAPVRGGRHGDAAAGWRDEGREAWHQHPTEAMFGV